MAPDAPWSEKGKMESEGPIMHVQPEDAVNQYDVDYEKHGAGRESSPLPDLKRKLKSRHLQMIAIGESRYYAPQRIRAHLGARRRILP